MNKVIRKCSVRTTLKYHLIADLFSGFIQEFLVHQNFIRFLRQPPIQNLWFIYAIF